MKRRFLAAAAVPALLLAIGCKTTVTGPMQTQIAGPVTQATVNVHRVPVDPLSTSAEAATIEDDELVLGVVAGGAARAYPIRYLALYEVLNDTLGEAALAPTW